jgi:hypothetical protein
MGPYLLTFCFNLFFLRHRELLYVPLYTVYFCILGP